jgi:hypothetical protein
LPTSRSGLAIALASFFDESEGGAAYPSLKTLADKAAMSKPNTVRLLRLFEAAGHLRIESGRQGAGHCSRYWMADPEKRSIQSDLFSPEKRSAQVDLSKTEKRSIQSEKRSIAMDLTLLEPSREERDSQIPPFRLGELALLAESARLT